MYGDEKFIFDIAVYSVPSEKFFALRQKKLEEHFSKLNSMLPISLQRSVDSNDTYDMEIRERFKKKYGGWQFTQAVGWIRLFPLYRQMRAEYWFVDSKRINVHMTRRIFEYCGKAFELTYFTGPESSAEIFNQIKQMIENLNQEKPFKGRYIDMEPFQNIGLFVNWRSLIGLE